MDNVLNCNLKQQFVKFPFMFQNLEELNVSNSNADDDFFNFLGVYCTKLRYCESNSIVFVSVLY